MDRFLIGFALLGGVGKVPFAGGTVATLAVGVPAAFILSRLPAVFALAMVLLVSVLGVLGSGLAIRDLGRQDPREVVADELAGFMVTMLWLPASWIALLAGFILFRLFDIWKPWPIRWVDANVKGGLGVMLDDILAGLAAHFLLRILLMVLE